jgi:hypothetical protein
MPTRTAGRAFQDQAGRTRERCVAVGIQEPIQIRFVASDAQYKELKRILSIMIPADVFHAAV